MNYQLNLKKYNIDYIIKKEKHNRKNWFLLEKYAI